MTRNETAAETPAPTGEPGTATRGDAGERLIAAALAEVADFGLGGTTTRSIAERAGVNEVTLFRRFGSKQELVAAAIEQAIQPFRASLAEPSDDLETDLVPIAAGFAAFADTNHALMARVLAEMVGDSPLMETVRPLQRTMFEHLRSVLEHHQRAGRLAGGPVDDALRAFVGPLAARAILSRVAPPGDFDATTHVRHYLHGWAP